MTTSANKAVVVNTRERAVSTDIVRMQQLLGAGAAEFAKSLLLEQVTDETSDGGTPVLNLAIATPLTAIFVGGGLVKPIPASTNVSIDPSVAWVVYPDAVASADDSPIKFIVDPGLASGTLSMTAGDAALTRVDVVECQPTLQVIETASREIFDPATGLFAAQTVNKITALRWTYRIRTGTVGAGMPANQLGWLPLMVAVVPALAATWDDCVFIYDVRPLAADYVRAPFNIKRTQPTNIRTEVVTGYQYDANPAGYGTEDHFINGIAEWAYNGKIAGGPMPASGYDLSTTSYATAGFLAGLGANVRWSFYAAFPFSLPRWAQYTAVSGITQRVPLPFRGIPMASLTNPSSYTRVPSAALTLPSATGLGATTTTNAICIWDGYSAGASAIAQASCAKDWVMMPEGGNTLRNCTVAAGALVTGAVFLFNLVEGQHVPFGAKAVRLKLAVSFTTGGAGLVNRSCYIRGELGNEGVAVYKFDGGDVIKGFGDHTMEINTVGAAATAKILGCTTEFELPPSFPGKTAVWAAKTWSCAIVAGPANADTLILAGTGSAIVVGYKL